MQEQSQEIRSKILEYYDMDINEAKSSFSSRNHAYIFPDDAIIRVGIDAVRTRSHLMSELLWMDELRQYSDTICKPYPSLRNHFFEQVELDGKVYTISKFKKARGHLLSGPDIDGWTAMHVGELLGRIHKTSYEAEASGIHYKRPIWREMNFYSTEDVADLLKPESITKMRSIFEKVDGIEKNMDVFGMVHGDFGSNNYYVEGNNVWIFDFDDCHYNYYMFDIATTFISWMSLPGFMRGATRREVLFQRGILKDFRYGYERHKTLPEEQWALLELFLNFRMAGILLHLARFVKEDVTLGAVGPQMDVKAIFSMMEPIFLMDDIFAGLDKLYELSALAPQPEAAPAKGGLTVEGDPLEGVLRVVGRISYNTAPILEKHLAPAIASGQRGLVLDFDGVTFLSSAGIRVLLKTYKALEDGIKLIHVSDSVEEVLDTVGMREYLMD